MRRMTQLVYGGLVTALLAGCGSVDHGMGIISGGGGGGGGGPAPNAVNVSLGNNFFRSARNRTMNAAVDTVAVGGQVTWSWVNTGMVPHNVQSVGTPSFASGGIETGSGSTYQVTFTTPGTYRYNCAIHGNLMTGIIVVTNSSGAGGY
jgi:plastocyanin